MSLDVPLLCNCDSQYPAVTSKDREEKISFSSRCYQAVKESLFAIASFWRWIGEGLKNFFWCTSCISPNDQGTNEEKPCHRQDSTGSVISPLFPTRKDSMLVEGALVIERDTPKICLDDFRSSPCSTIIEEDEDLNVIYLDDFRGSFCTTPVSMIWSESRTPEISEDFFKDFPIQLLISQNRSYFYPIVGD